MQRILLETLKTLKSGELSINILGDKIAKLNIQNGSFTINLENSSTLLNLLDSTEKFSGTSSILKNIKRLRNLATALKKEKLTLNILFLDRPILILGKDANPKLSQILTTCSAIEFKSLTRILKMLKSR